MFKIGQLVRINDNASWLEEYGYDQHDIFRIIDIQIRHNCYFYDISWIKSKGNKQKSNNSLRLFVEEIESVDPCCPICYQDVGVENNKIKKHENDGKLCYGSFIPCSK